MPKREDPAEQVALALVRKSSREQWFKEDAARRAELARRKRRALRMTPEEYASYLEKRRLQRVKRKQTARLGAGALARAGESTGNSK